MQLETQVAPGAILEAALQLAASRGWDGLHLYDVAHELGVDLSQIRRHFPDKDAVAEAWFDRADEALFQAGQRPGWAQLPLPERLHDAMSAWYQALAAHRVITRDMLGYKFQPEHLHLQALGIMRISRTVQWIREVALVPAVGWRRELAEAVLTSIFLSAFAFWLFDDSMGARRTHEVLDRLLRGADWGAKALAYPAR